ncbi:MAG: aldehyde dehydrogenase family protein, partial [Terriglobales bacterium]
MSAAKHSEDREHSVIGEVNKNLFIGGKWQAAQNGRTFQVTDPATGKALCEVADASPADGMAALDAAVTAQAGFAAMAPRERGEILHRSYERMMQRQDDLALLMTLEMGKPLAESKGEIAYA